MIAFRRISFINLSRIRRLVFKNNVLIVSSTSPKLETSIKRKNMIRAKFGLVIGKQNAAGNKKF